MPTRKKVLAVSAAAVLATAAPIAVVTATQAPAVAVTDQCQNGPRPVSGPVGCGTLFLPGVGYPHAGNALTLTAGADTFGAPVTVAPMDGSARQDFTLYQVCATLNTESRSAAQPCGGGQAVAGRFVIEFTPFGQLPGGGVNSFESLCLDDNDGRAVLGFCQSGGAWYGSGFPNPPMSDGAPPVAENPNPAETWQAVADGSGSELVNMHSGGALDDSGFGGPGTDLIVYSRNGGANQVWEVIGCTDPLAGLHGLYGCMPR
jgi:hypothetical protein